MRVPDGRRVEPEQCGRGGIPIAQPQMPVEPENRIGELIRELWEAVLDHFGFMLECGGDGQHLRGRQRSQADEPLDRPIAVHQQADRSGPDQRGTG